VPDSAIAESHPLPPWTDNADPAQNTWDYDLWSDGGFGWPIYSDDQPTRSDGAGDYLFWAEMINLGIEPEVNKGDVFAVVVTHDNATPPWDPANPDEVNPDYGGTADRVGFFSDNSLGIPTWKFYEMGRNTDGAPPPSAGWWIRAYTWDFAVAVDITGDLPPTISDMDQLPTTLSTEDRTVTATIVDTNPGGGESGVAVADLVYTLNGGDEVRVAMTAAGDVYSGVIPGQQPGTEVTYWIEVEDVAGNAATSAISVTYNIFETVYNNALLVFNGYDSPTGYPQSYYFGKGDFSGYTVQDWDHDVWCYGPLTEELLSAYNNVIEFCTLGPAFDNTEVIQAWLEADGTRNYMVAGDEFLGAIAYGWPGSHNPVDTEEGEFAHDILGVTTYYGDLVESSTDANPVFAAEGSALGGDLFNLHAQVSSDNGWTATMNYDPTYELNGVEPNWLDGADFAGDVEVDMTAISTDTTNGTAGTEFNIAGHRTLAAGNKIAFLSYDPLSINSGFPSHDEYYWYGFTAEAPQVKALVWFEALIVGVEDELSPATYTLAQNYPNPFNPSTKIAFSVPTQGNVTLKIYNMLGQEVATLLDEVRNAGVHEVAFDGINLSSGVYFYTLTAGDFVSTKKMMLLK
jgi:hypothetical protein